MINKSMEEDFWYPVRVTEGGCLQFKQYLDSRNYPNYFNPEAFHNLCFIQTGPSGLDTLLKEIQGRFSVQCIWDGVNFGPARVPDKTMQDFMTVAESPEENHLYLHTVSTLLKDCRKVRVTSGKYRGIEGKLVRIKKEKRIMIELPGSMAVATEYIRPECLEIIG